MKGARRRILAAAVIVLVVGGAVAIFLGDYFGPVKSNIRQLGNPDPQVQKQAIDALVQMGQTAVDNKPPREVADRLGLSVGAVYIAKSRLQKTSQHLC